MKKYQTVYILLFLPTLLFANAVTTGTDEQAKLPYWQYKNDEISIRFIQRLPDQTRGYFMARGFSPKHAELVANSCVFQSIFKNTSDKSTPLTIDYDMASWKITHHSRTSNMKTREDWATQWSKLNITNSAKLAFNWGLLPTTQHYQPGDYNWGMATFNLASGEHFDLTLTWQQSTKQFSIEIPNMQCAADIHPEPEAP